MAWIIHESRCCNGPLHGIEGASARPGKGLKGGASSTQEASDSTAWELKSFALGLQTPNGLNVLQMYVSSRCQLT